MKKKVLMFFLGLFLILCSYSVLALTISYEDNYFYNSTGGEDFWFGQGEGLFNDEQMQTSSDYNVLSTAVLDEGLYTPLISDMNNDGTSEILVLDDDTLKIYTANISIDSLILVDSVALTQDGYYSNFILYDIDGDGYTEAIIAYEYTSNPYHEAIDIFEYNSTDFYREYVINLSKLDHTTGEMAIQCRDTNTCLLIYGSDQTVDGAATDMDIYGASFNSTNVTDYDIMIKGGSAWSVNCFNGMKHVGVADYDSDGIDEYVFSMMTYYGATGGTDDYPSIAWIEELDNRSLYLDQILIITGSDEFLGAESTTYACRNGFLNNGRRFYIGDFVSPTLTFDAVAGNGLETIMAYHVALDEWVLKSFRGCSADGCTSSELDDFPETCDLLGNCPTGYTLSNPVRADVFDGGEGYDDFCVAGFDDDEEVIDVICGSETSTHYLTETMEIVYWDTPYNISRSYTLYNNLIHTAQHKTETSYDTNKNLPEFVTSYGVLEIVDADTLTPDFESIFDNPKDDAVVLSLDYERTELDDLVVMQENNLWYIDDNWVNSPAYISYYKLDPICDAVIKINSTLEATITVNNQVEQEDETDDTGARVILYYDNPNEQDSNWTANYTAGTEIEFIGTSDLLVFNKTTASATLRIMGRDTENPDNPDYIDFDFSVGSTGVETGDCYTEYTVPNPLEEEEEEEDETALNASLTPADDNLIKEGIIEMNAFLKLGLTGIWLLFMIFLDYLLIVQAGHYFHGLESRYVFGIAGLIDVLWIILGTMLGVFPFWITLLLLLAFVAIVVLWATQKFNTNQGSGV